MYLPVQFKWRKEKQFKSTEIENFFAFFSEINNSETEIYLVKSKVHFFFLLLLIAIMNKEKKKDVW